MHALALHNDIIRVLINGRSIDLGVGHLGHSFDRACHLVDVLLVKCLEIFVLEGLELILKLFRVLESCFLHLRHLFESRAERVSDRVAFLLLLSLVLSGDVFRELHGERHVWIFVD